MICHVLLSGPVRLLSKEAQLQSTGAFHDHGALQAAMVEPQGVIWAFRKHSLWFMNVYDSISIWFQHPFGPPMPSQKALQVWTVASFFLCRGLSRSDSRSVTGSLCHQSCQAPKGSLPVSRFQTLPWDGLARCTQGFYFYTRSLNDTIPWGV